MRLVAMMLPLSTARSCVYSSHKFYFMISLFILLADTDKLCTAIFEYKYNDSCMAIVIIASRAGKIC